MSMECHNSRYLQIQDGFEVQSITASSEDQSYLIATLMANKKTMDLYGMA